MEKYKKILSLRGCGRAMVAIFGAAAVYTGAVTIMLAVLYVSRFAESISYGCVEFLGEISRAIDDILEYIYYRVPFGIALAVVLIGSTLIWHFWSGQDGRKSRLAKSVRMFLRIASGVLLAVLFGEIMEYKLDEFNSMKLKLFLLLSAVAGNMLGELLIALMFPRRGFGIKNFSVGIILSVLIICVFLLVRADITGTQCYVPEVDKIVSVHCDWDTELNEQDNIKALTELHKLIIENKTANEKAENTENLYFSYELKDGTHVSRKYLVNFENEDGLDPQVTGALKILNCTEARLDRVWLPEQDKCTFVEAFFGNGACEWNFYDSCVEVTEKQLWELHDGCMVPDAEESNLGWSIFRSSENPYDCRKVFWDMCLWITLRDEDGNTEMLVIPIDRTATRTLRWMNDTLGISPVVNDG